MGFQLFAKPRGNAGVTSAAAEKAEAPKATTGSPSYILRIQTGKWAGNHQVEILRKERAALHKEVHVQHSAQEELAELQGEWQLQSVRSKNMKRKQSVEPSKETQGNVQIFVRGKRVEEKRGKERTFFNLVLVKKALSQTSQTSKDTPRQLPPLEGPKVLPDASKGKGKGKGRGKGKTKKGKGQKQRGHSVGHWILLHHTPKILVKPDCRSSLLWWHPTEHAVWSRGGDTIETCTVRYLSDSHTEALERHGDDPPETWRTKKGMMVQLISKL